MFTPPRGRVVRVYDTTSTSLKARNSRPISGRFLFGIFDTPRPGRRPPLRAVRWPALRCPGRGPRPLRPGQLAGPPLRVCPGGGPCGRPLAGGRRWRPGTFRYRSTCGGHGPATGKGTDPLPHHRRRRGHPAAPASAGYGRPVPPRWASASLRPTPPRPCGAGTPLVPHRYPTGTPPARLRHGRAGFGPPLRSGPRVLRPRGWRPVLHLGTGARVGKSSIGGLSTCCS